MNLNAFIQESISIIENYPTSTGDYGSFRHYSGDA